jgi:hypothetical protein
MRIHSPVGLISPKHTREMMRKASNASAILATLRLGSRVQPRSNSYERLLQMNLPIGTLITVRTNHEAKHTDDIVRNR